MYQNMMKKSNNSIVKQKKDKPEGKNMTGIPTQMRMKFEGMSGLSFDDVKVHYNSDKPAQMKALAYTQGNDVYIGPGQEKHLGHELGHVVQQKQGRVKPTEKMGGQLVNSDAKLEKEADQMSATAIQMKRESGGGNSEVVQFISPFSVKSQKGKFVGKPSAVHIHIVKANTHIKCGSDRTDFDEEELDGLQAAYGAMVQNNWFNVPGGQECLAWLLQEAEGMDEQLVAGKSNSTVWMERYPTVNIATKHSVQLAGYQPPVEVVNKPKRGKGGKGKK